VIVLALASAAPTTSITAAVNIPRKNLALMVFTSAFQLNCLRIL
jgi:hypothetical protein